MYRLPPDRMAGYQRAQISCPNCRASIIVRNLGGDILDARLATREVSGPVLVTDVRPQSHAIVPQDPTWFVAVGRDRKGPFSPQQLSELLAVGTISAQSLVWHKGMANWVPMCDVLELRTLIRPSGSYTLASGQPPAMPRPDSQGQSADPGQQPPAAGEPSHPAQPLRPISEPMTPVQAAAMQAAPGQAAPAQAVQAQAVQAHTVQAHTVQAQAAPPRPISQPAQAAPARPVSQPAPAAPVQARPISQPVAPAASHAARASESDLHRVEAETHSESFFTSHHDLDHVALAMPDTDKHKPTKEEYQNLLQEFSVMFRLDKRSKRQKILIAVLIATAVLGAIGFGLTLRWQGAKKAQLLTDANNILGMFNLPYQTSVTIDVGNDAPEPPSQPGEAPKPKKAAEPAKEVQLSDLAAKMRTVVKAKAKAVKVATGPTVSKEEEARLMAALNSGGPGPKGPAIGAEDVSSADIRKMCAAQAPSLRACGQSAGVGEFKVRFNISTAGKIEDVKASADGKEDAGLSSCAEAKLRKVHFSSQTRESAQSCVVD